MYSLRRRLLISASGLLILFFGLLGIILVEQFKETVLENAQSALRNQILLLMAEIEVFDGRIELPERVSEPRLSQADADLYAQIRSPANVVWRSESLLDESLTALPAAQGVFGFYDLDETQDGLFHSTFKALWETEQGDLPFTVQVAERADLYLKRIQRYQRALWVWLALLGGALLLLLWTVLAWALKPLAKVSQQVGEIEQGDRRRFDEDFPQEVAQLTQNLNQLLNFEEQRIERHKEVLGNLAHSLKTPIAVLSGLKFSAQNELTVTPQLDIMRNIIEYQLQSASAVGRRRFAKPVRVAEPTGQILTSLAKLYKDKGILVDSSIPADLSFYGDQGDWMELLGNLLDNAYKWAQARIELKLSAVVTASAECRHRGIEIRVIDDGVGIDPEVRQTVIERGIRLDSQTPGHGLGLHIVKGIVEAYDGHIQIDSAANGGTRFCITLA